MHTQIFQCLHIDLTFLTGAFSAFTLQCFKGYFSTMVPVMFFVSVKTNNVPFYEKYKSKGVCSLIPNVTICKNVKTPVGLEVRI